MKTVEQDPNWVTRKLQELQSQIEGLRSERRAAATSVSDGDFVVEGGGAILLKDGGDLRTEHPNGVTALRVGGLSTGGGNPAEGFVLRDPSERLIVAAYTDTVNGERVVLLGGDATTPLKLLQAIAEYQYVEATNGDIVLKVPSGRRVFVSHDTTGASANCFINTDGSIWRSTSSRRYKQDEEPVNINPDAVLQLVAKTWRDRLECEQNPDTRTRYIGFIAEEVDELGLSEFVVYDDDGRPDAIAYDRLSVALLAVVKDQNARLERLEAAVAALTPEA